MARLIYTNNLADEMKQRVKMGKKGKAKGVLQTNAVTYTKNGKHVGTLISKSKRDAHDSNHPWN